MHTVTESIFSGSVVIVPMADVQHIEKWDRPTSPGIRIITKHTRWDNETSDWTNAIWISEPEATAFRSAWSQYRSEIEADTLMDLSPDASTLMKKFDETIDALKRA
jgi:hypothetical protein